MGTDQIGGCLLYTSKALGMASEPAALRLLVPIALARSVKQV